jgi:tetratricopeptide (TPR) repeat protein
MERKLIISTLLLLESFPFFAQNIEANRDKIKQASAELAVPFSEYFNHIPTTDLDTLFNKLITSKAYHAENEFHNYLIGGVLYNIDADKSFEYHEKAYKARPNDQNFILEYALELHRKKQFDKAAELYEKYMLKNVEDKGINALLADCYINTGDIKKAIDYWNKADHANKHTEIDFAINSVYGLQLVIF